jgi:hypothetical protein
VIPALLHECDAECDPLTDVMLDRAAAQHILAPGIQNDGVALWRSWIITEPRP